MKVPFKAGNILIPKKGWIMNSKINKKKSRKKKKN